MRKILFTLASCFPFAAIAFAHEGHEHVATNISSIEWGLKGAQELINMHPLFVHFPIALLLTSTAFYFLGTLFRKEDLFVAGKWELYLGTLSAAVTVWTGLQAAKTVPHGGGTHEIMMAHQYFGFAVLGLSALLSIWVFISKANIPSKGRIFFLAGLLLLSATLTQGADLGGRMVFLHGVGVEKKSMVAEESHSLNPGGEKHAGQEHDTHEHNEHAH